MTWRQRPSGFVDVFRPRPRELTTRRRIGVGERVAPTLARTPKAVDLPGFTVAAASCPGGGVLYRVMIERPDGAEIELASLRVGADAAEEPRAVEGRYEFNTDRAGNVLGADVVLSVGPFVMRVPLPTLGGAL